MVSNGTSSPLGITETDGNCVVGASGAWTSGSCSGTSNITIGTSASTTNPQRSGQAGTGLFSATSNTVSIAANGIKAMEWDTVALGVDYFVVTPSSASTTDVILSAAGSDPNIGLSLNPKGNGAVAITNANTGTTQVLTLQNTNANGYTTEEMIDNAGTLQAQFGVGGTTTGLNYFYLNEIANNPMAFYTNSTERMRILAAGGLAIGTTSAGAGSPLLTVAGPITTTAAIKTGGYTVSTLPAGTVGQRAYVTDQTTSCPAAGAALTGSGGVTCPVFYNGSAWVGD